MKALLNPTTDELNFIDAFRRSSDETKELAMKMYYSGVSGRGIGKVL